MKGTLYVAGAGAVTAAGLNARQTLAAIRASLSAFEDMNLKEPFGATQIVARIPTHWKLRRSQGEWLVNMAGRAIKEALRSGPVAAEATALLISPPENFRQHPAFETVPLKQFLPAIFRSMGENFHKESRAVDGGPAACMSLIERAVEIIQKPGVEQVILGGVDSYVNDADMTRLSASNRLRGPESAQGLVPGEGAVFVRLTRSPEAGEPVIAAIRNVAMEMEEDTVLTERFSQGRALLSALRSAVADNGPAEPDISFVVSNGNGERHRALEELTTHSRFYRTLRDLTPIAYPAMTTGEIGSASGALALMLAADSFRKNYAPGPVAMLEIASESGLRAAAVVTAMRRD